MDRAGSGIYPDLLHHYGVDLVAAIKSGRPSPKLLLSLIATLPMGSMTQALLMGDRSAFGWSNEVSVLADVVDATYDNMVGTAMGKFKKLPKRYPRPGTKATPAKGDGTVRGLARYFGVIC